MAKLKINDLVGRRRAGFSVRSALRADVFTRRQEIEEGERATWPTCGRSGGDNNIKVTTNETMMKVVIEAGDDCHMSYIRLFDSIQKSAKLLFIDPLGPRQSLSFVPVISVEESRIFSLILGNIGPQIGL